MPAESAILEWTLLTTSLVTRSEPPRQRIELNITAGQALNGVILEVFRGQTQVAMAELGDLGEGENTCACLLPLQKKPCDVRWVLRDTAGHILADKVQTWTSPRHWTLYMISSTHTDIGLHNSQYIQRYSNVGNVESAAKLIDRTADRGDDSCYRYVMEGTWVWGNYEQDRSEEAARKIVRNCVLPGKMGIGAATAGNHTQVYGFEELCRSAYTRRVMKERWGVAGSTMTMIDNNGLSWALVPPYADAGFKNVVFAPNQWNPLVSTLNPMDKDKEGPQWNPDAGGGGTRVDVRWDSELPLVFYWDGADGVSRLLVWASVGYPQGGTGFGIFSNRKAHPATPEFVAPVLSRRLAKLEARYPYDVWMFASYHDDEPPNLYLADFAAAWNEQWQSPTFRLVGDLDEPFDRLRDRFGDRIPTLRGDITSGWAQHPVCTPELLAQKFAADRLLPTAEKLASLARIVDPAYIYPATEFRRAWDGLICNDEHSYGTSGYQGRRVYETWMQHRDWIDKAEATAKRESRRALETLSRQIPAPKKSVVIFNPTLVPRVEVLETEINGDPVKVLTPEVPSFGYVTLPCSELTPAAKPQVRTPQEPPVLENGFYRLTFASNGAIVSIFDKELSRELLDSKAAFHGNQFVYTKDNHETFVSPEDARFTITSDAFGQTVTVTMDDPHTRAAIEQHVTLPNHEKRIEIENRFSHVYDLFNTHRYYRYGYYAFPFAVDGGAFRTQLNGCIATPKKDQTGHGTDVYLPARDWSCVENNDFGVALMQLDSQLVEFGRIHPDKTEFGVPFETSHLYSYIFTDWLQMHTTGGSAINPRFRYVITSYTGDYRTAGISQLADRLTQPLLSTVIPAQDGKLPAERASFMSADQPNVSLLTLKLAETPGRGFIARLHETDGKPLQKVSVNQSLSDFSLTACSLIEEDREELETFAFPIDGFGYATVCLQHALQEALDVPKVTVDQVTDNRIGLSWGIVPNAAQYHVYRGRFHGFAPDEYHLLATTLEPSFTDTSLSPGETYFYRIAAVDKDTHQGDCSEELEVTTEASGPSAPAKIGSFYTGLIDTPKAGHGAEPDQLYLIWGQNTESDLSHYELYRSETPGFVPDGATFLADIEPGPYCVALRDDRELKIHTTYYYRVRAVDKDGNKGEFSDEFSGTTREPYDIGPA